jgi:hypothetical protein
MGLRAFVSLIAFSFFFFWSQAYAAGALPSQSLVCSSVPEPRQTAPVIKRKLIGLIISKNPEALSRMLGDLAHYDAILKNDNYCSATVDCRNLKKDACDSARLDCARIQDEIINTAQKTLLALKEDSTASDPGFRMSAALMGMDDAGRLNAYLATTADDGIVCIGPKKAKVPQSAAAEDVSPLRVRGVSNDLLIRRDNPVFGSTSQATLTFSGDHTTTQTQKAKAVGAVGYAFERGLATAVPYFSFYQSVTDVKGKARSLDDANFVAAGTVFTATVPGDVLVQTFSGKPQFLENTKDNSQIASLTLMYKPFTAFDVSGGGFNLNDPRPIPFWPSAYGEVIFDLRADLGRYTNRGNDPVQSLLNQDYARAGSHFGFSVTTDAKGPSFTLTVVETYLYGFVGTVRNLDLFETSLTYNFDEKKYVGLKASYTKGRNEDTAVPVQTWMVGLSARY